jgi:ABC-2 type transport system permease protein
MFIRSILALVGSQLIELRRSRTALFWMLAFPIGFLLLFGFVMARGDGRITAVLMPGLLTTTLLSGALFGVALPLIQQRESGLLRRLRVTPVTAAAVAIAHGITALMTGFLSIVILMLMARAIFNVQMAGSWLSLAGVFVCGAVALIPIGLLVGSTARDLRTAPGIANLLFFPLMFLSGSAMPFAVLPEGVKRFARLLPTTYLVDTYSSVIVRGEGLIPIAGSLAVLLGVGVVGVVLTSMLFRWEGTDPISRKALATIAMAFAATLGVAAFVAPAIRMGDLPGARRIEPGDAKGQVLVLRGATVLDGLGGRIVNARVVIRDHKIADVSLDDERVALPEGARVEDLKGRYLIPGLFDSHVHWGGSGGIGASPVEQTDDRLAHDFSATLASGVTSVVSLTDDLANMRSLSAAVAAAKQRAAHVLLGTVDYRQRRASCGDVRLHAGAGRAAHPAGRHS